jgi:hypothetical protein
MQKILVLAALSLLSCSLAFGSASLLPAQAQSDAAPAASPTSAAPAGIVLPDALPKPIAAASRPGQYVLEFNRSPIVGNRLRFDGIYDENRLRFTRPRNWQTKAAKVQIRFRHSAALYASRSNLTVFMNGTSIGSIPLNKRQNEIGSVVFDVPPGLIQDYNELTIAALQNNSPTCTQDPYDPSLWTEVLPDSRLVLEYQPQPIALDFSRYPYPLFDILSLEPNQLAYLLPKTVDEPWLTAATRLQTALGRVAEFRPLETQLVKSPSEVQADQRLMVIGTPANQPALASLNLPLEIENQKILDGEQQPLPPDVGVLMLTTANENRTPVFIATGNTPEAVAKAVQFLVQTGDRQIGTGSVVLVNQLADVPSPPPRDWAGYLPLSDAFQLKDLTTFNDEPIADVTVRGSNAPALQFGFRAHPDDRFAPGNVMTLNYSYGPQVNPLTSLVEVQLDGVTLAGSRLTNVDGATRQSMRVNIPEAAIKPDSRMQVNFRLDPRERRSCSRVTDQQLWGTIHADSSFELNRENVVRLPDLKLLRTGYPFVAPQDLSETAIVMPDSPSNTDLLLLLEVGERLGRLSQSESIQLSVHRASQLSPEQRSTHQLIAIGTQAEFPLPEALKTNGFDLEAMFSRRWQQSQVQTLPDVEGVVKQILSPWNDDRTLLALTAQTAAGLNEVRSLLSQDPLFYQIEGDTVLISANETNPSPYDPNDYNLEFLQQSPQREIVSTHLTNRLLWVLRNNWFVLAPAIVVASLVLYGVVQLYLKRLTGQEQ